MVTLDKLNDIHVPDYNFQIWAYSFIWQKVAAEEDSNLKEFK